MINYRKPMYHAAMVVMIATLAGCDLFKKTASSESSAASDKAQSSSAVLCSINGEAVITQEDFAKNLNQMIEANPYFRGATAEQLPKELQRRFFEQLVTQALIEKHALAKGVDKKADFVKTYEDTQKLLKRTLLVQTVEKDIYDSITVDEKEISKYFDENKERFVKTPGGTLTIGVRFETDFAADLFLGKVRNNVDQFEKLAKEEKSGKFRDFGRVSKEPNRNMQVDIVPGPVKDAVAALNKFPSVEKVKVGKEVWVIKAWDKKNAENFALDEVKQHIEGMLKNNKFRDVLDKQVKDIKEGFKVVINEDFFKSAEQPAGQEEADDKENTASSAA